MHPLATLATGAMSWSKVSIGRRWTPICRPFKNWAHLNGDADFQRCFEMSCKADIDLLNLTVIHTLAAETTPSETVRGGALKRGDQGWMTYGCCEFPDFHTPHTVSNTVDTCATSPAKVSLIVVMACCSVSDNKSSKCSMPLSKSGSST